jgi:hypothetical protein
MSIRWLVLNVILPFHCMCLGMLKLELRLLLSPLDVLELSLVAEMDYFFSLSSSCRSRLCSLSNHFFDSNERELQISGGTCANFHTIATFEDG